MTNYLFIHQNFPGQFPHITKALAERGHTVVAIGEARLIRQRGKPHPSIKIYGYPEPNGAGTATHHYLRDFEGHVRRGQAVFRIALNLVQQGFKPDVVVAHPGWGEALFLKDAFPHARHVHYLEFFYRAHGADVGFDPEFPGNVDSDCKTRIRNSTQLIGLEYADAGISPTACQRSRYPQYWQPKIAQLHDGIDTSRAYPSQSAFIDIAANGMTPPLRLTRNDEVLTYVARNLEPYRGFHSFMRAVPAILELRPTARIVVIGGDGVSYGRRLPEGETYRSRYTKEWPATVDLSRVHFMGRLPYSEYLRVLQLSSLHIYLTYPFVLSWSMLEAMSAGCIVLGSDTEPVREVIRNGDNGFLVDFFDTGAIATRVADLLASRSQLDEVRKSARQTILAGYDLHSQCLPRLLDFLQM